MISLPRAFVERMRRELGGDADAFLDAMEQPPVRGLRMNPDKKPTGTPGMPLPECGAAVPWAAHGLYLPLNSRAGASPLHACGAYYLQEPSAMLPAALLCPKPGETVLDLCAAPGGKSTQLAAMMQGSGTLVCNEPVTARAETLSGNLERMGVTNALAVSADPETLARRWPRLFNAILIDAPCSGEGMFRRHPEARLEWEEGVPAACAKRQLRILESASRMLAQGGRLCYSTCTFSETENEGVIRDFLSRHPEFQPINFQISIGGGRTLASGGGCVRLYPHQVQGEGHFAALLVKTGLQAGEAPPAQLLPPDRVFAPPDKQMLAVFAALWGALSTAQPPQPNAAIGNLLISAPPLPPMDGLKAFRAGLSLGRVKGSVCIPDHALCLAAPPPLLRSIPLDEASAARYIGGEVLPAGPADKGFAAVTCAGLPLGFVKCSDGQMKNHYPKGLRKR